MTGVEGFVGTGRYLVQPLAPDNGVIQLAGEMLHVDAHRGLISIVRAATPKYD